MKFFLKRKKERKKERSFEEAEFFMLDAFHAILSRYSVFFLELSSHSVGMHAREWIGSAVATYIISQLVEKNSSYAKLLENSDWMILPVANPDGYEYSHTSDRLWRKTRSNHEENQEDSRYDLVSSCRIF